MSPPNAGFLAASEDPNRIRRDGSRCAAVAISNLGLRVVRGAYKVSPAAHQQLIQCLQRSLRLCSLASARNQVRGERFQLAGKALVQLAHSAGQKSALNDRVHAPHSELGRLVFRCQPWVLLELGCDGYFRGGARRAENAKHASSCQIESLRRGDASRPQDLDPQQLAIVAKCFDLIGSEHPVGAIASVHQPARVHAVRGVEQNGCRPSSSGGLQP